MIKRWFLVLALVLPVACASSLGRGEGGGADGASDSGSSDVVVQDDAEIGNDVPRAEDEGLVEEDVFLEDVVDASVGKPDSGFKDVLEDVVDAHEVLDAAVVEDVSVDVVDLDEGTPDVATPADVHEASVDVSEICREARMPGVGDKSVLLQTRRDWVIQRVRLNRPIMDARGYVTDSWSELAWPSCQGLDTLHFPIEFVGHAHPRAWLWSVEVTVRDPMGRSESCMYPSYEGCGFLLSNLIYEDGPMLSMIGREDYLHQDGSRERLFLHLPSGTFVTLPDPASLSVEVRGEGATIPSALFYDSLDVRTVRFIPSRMPHPAATLFTQPMFRPLHRPDMYTMDVDLGGVVTRLGVVEFGRCRQINGDVDVEQFDASAMVWRPVPYELLPEIVPDGTQRCFVHVLGELCPPGRPYQTASGRCGERAP